jgi:hypothetical protein
MNTPEDDLDSTALLRRANTTTARVETYDPNQLVQDIANLLQQRGLQPHLPAGSGRSGIAHGAAGTLLRAFGILPASTYTTIDRINAPDTEDR